MTHSLTMTLKISPELKAKLQRLADAEGERMVSDSEMVRRLIERAQEPATNGQLKPVTRTGDEKAIRAVRNGVTKALEKRTK